MQFDTGYKRHLNTDVLKNFLFPKIDFKKTLFALKFDSRMVNPYCLRDGPLENLWGGRAKYKKKIRAREN